MRGTWLWRLAAIALAITAPACNGADGSAARDSAITRTLETVQRGLAAADGEAVCDALTATGTYELARLRGGAAGDCARVVDQFGKREDERWRPKEFEVLSIRLYGRRASVLVQDDTGRGEPYGVPFALDRSGAWRLTSLVLLDVEAVDNPPYGPTRPYVEPPRETPQEDLYDIQSDFARDRGESVCDDLTPSAQREAQKYGRPGESCPDAVRTIKARLIARGHQLRASRLLSVRIEGDRATLLVKDPGGPPYRVPAVRGPGDWKLTSLRHAEPIELGR